MRRSEFNVDDYEAMQTCEYGTNELFEKTITCPYCWERFSTVVEPSLELGETYVEDCYICCRPIEMTVVAKEEDSIDIRATAIDGNAF